jgi:hypothetical protein
MAERERKIVGCASQRERERECVLVGEKDSKRERERERERECVLVREKDRKRERERERERERAREQADGGTGAMLIP